MGAPGTTPGTWRAKSSRVIVSRTEHVHADGTTMEYDREIAMTPAMSDEAQRWANALQLAAGGALYDALVETESWLTAALECETWVWDGDQHHAATIARGNARRALAQARGEVSVHTLEGGL